MKKTIGIVLVCAALASCLSPPARPGSLWDELPQSEDDAAKEVPSKIWNDPSVVADSSMDSTGDATAAELMGAVVLNEMLYDAAGSDTDGNEFVELFGTPGIVISGCKINFVNGADGSVTDSITIPAGATLRQDGFYLIADSKDGSSTASNVIGADLIDNFDPQNGPDAVQLVAPDGQVIDALGYGEGIVPTSKDGLPSFEGTPAIDVASGHSLERKITGADTGDNAADFIEQGTPTPGFGPPAPETTPPERVPSPPQDAPPSEEPPADPTPQQLVVLNEIYYDAVGNDTNGVLFVELYGDPGSDVAGNKINFVNGDDGKIYDSVILPEDAVLRPDGFYVIADAKDGFSMETDVVGADFVDSFDPQNGPDAVQLLDAGGALLDAIGYGEGGVLLAENGLPDLEGLPAIDVMGGHSLERQEPGFDLLDNYTEFVDRETPTPGW